MSIIDFHLIGGLPYMALLTIVLITIIGLMIYSIVRKETLNPKWIEAIKQLAGFALAWGTFSTLVGLFQAFGDLEQTQDIIPFNVIMGGLKVALITALYGFGIFLFTHVCLIVLKLTKKETV